MLKMATPEVFAEDKCLNVYWKIKNFSFCCGEIRSPPFSAPRGEYFMELDLDSGLTCRLLSEISVYNPPAFEWELSILTCDGSPEISFSRNKEVPKDIVFDKRRGAFLPDDTLTVRFRSPISCGSGKLVISSHIVVERWQFLWPFLKFSEFNYSTFYPIKTSKAYGEVALFTRSTCGNNPDEMFSMYVRRLHGGERCYCVLRVSVLRADGRAVNEVRDAFVFQKSGEIFQTRGFPIVIEKNKMLASRKLLLPNDTLTLKCDFAISLGKIADGSSQISFCENGVALLREVDDISMSCGTKVDSECVIEFKVHMENLLEEGLLYDVALQAGSEVVRAHRNILSERSPVFRDMFTREAATDTALVEDFSAETVRSLLLYMYTDTLRDDRWPNVRDLYSAACRYEVTGLKKKCSSLLGRKLSLSSICDASVLAYRHQDEELKRAALAFIYEFGRSVFASDGWKDLEQNSASLALQIMRELYCKHRELS